MDHGRCTSLHRPRRHVDLLAVASRRSAGGSEPGAGLRVERSFLYRGRHANPTQLVSLVPELSEVGHAQGNRVDLPEV
jgi:hypothetical protein